MAHPPRKAFPLRLDPALFAALERAAAGDLPALFAALERAAAGDLRSVNAEIEVLLREALARRGVRIATPEPARRGRPPRSAPLSPHDGTAD